MTNAALLWSLRSNEILCYTALKIITRLLCVNGWSSCGAHHVLTVTWYHSECCVPSELAFKTAGGSVICCCLPNYLLQTHRVTVNRTWALFHGCKCGNTWKSAHILFGRLVRCSAHGCSFARLRYHYYSSVNYQQELTFLCNFSHALQNPIAVIESKKFMYWRCTYQHPFSTL